MRRGEHSMRRGERHVRIQWTAFFVLGTVLMSGQGNAQEPTPAEATRRGDIASLRAILEGGSDPNAAESDGATALHWAVYRDDVEAARLLIESGAAYKGENIAVQWLVDNGADLEAVDNEGRNALVWSQGVLATLAKPRRRQPHTEALILELMETPAGENLGP